MLLNIYCPTYIITHLFQLAIEIHFWFQRENACEKIETSVLCVLNIFLLDAEMAYSFVLVSKW